MLYPATEIDVLAVAERWLEAGHGVALATVVNASGSAPRQIGSHIAVREDGIFAGSVSAGCVENAVIELARAALADGRNRSARFGVSDGIFTPGLLCGGEIEILVEPLGHARREEVRRILQAGAAGQAIIRALDIESGAVRLIDPLCDKSPLDPAARAAARADAARRVTVDGRDWLLTIYNPPWEIVIVGAVHIAQALVALAGPAGYRVRVIDPRDLYASPERFPGVALERDWPEQALALRPLTARSAIIMLAHDPKIDDEALIAASRSQAFYIGALGSARTHARRLTRLAGRGLSPEMLAQIRGPVGLAIGARTPAEIAIAILAELAQVRRVPRRIAGVVLAAGTSSRMGRNKLVEQVAGKALVRHAVDAALEAGLDPVIVVTGHEAGRVRAALADADVCFVHNDAFPDGLSRSLRAGIAAVPPDRNGAMVLLGDMPDVTSGLVRQLTAVFDPARGRAIIVANAQGERGHPVLWARQYFPQMESLKGDVGAKALLVANSGQVFDVAAADEAPITDLDTPAALAVRKDFASL